MKETNLATCKLCQVIKTRTQDGMFDDRNKRWVDEHNRMWNGRTCPDCQALKAKSNMRKLRKKDRDEQSSL